MINNFSNDKILETPQSVSTPLFSSRAFYNSESMKIDKNLDEIYERSINKGSIQPTEVDNSSFRIQPVYQNKRRSRDRKKKNLRNARNRNSSKIIDLTLDESDSEDSKERTCALCGKGVFGSDDLYCRLCCLYNERTGDSNKKYNSMEFQANNEAGKVNTFLPQRTSPSKNLISNLKFESEARPHSNLFSSFPLEPQSSFVNSATRPIAKENESLTNRSINESRQSQFVYSSKFRPIKPMSEILQNIFNEISSLKEETPFNMDDGAPNASEKHEVDLPCSPMSYNQLSTENSIHLQEDFGNQNTFQTKKSIPGFSSKEPKDLNLVQEEQVNAELSKENEKCETLVIPSEVQSLLANEAHKYNNNHTSSPKLMTPQERFIHDLYNFFFRDPKSLQKRPLKLNEAIKKPQQKKPQSVIANKKESMKRIVTRTKLEEDFYPSLRHSFKNEKKKINHEQEKEHNKSPMNHIKPRTDVQSGHKRENNFEINENDPFFDIKKKFKVQRFLQSKEMETKNEQMIEIEESDKKNAWNSIKDNVMETNSMSSNSDKSDYFMIGNEFDILIECYSNESESTNIFTVRRRMEEFDVLGNLQENFATIDTILFPKENNIQVGLSHQADIPALLKKEDNLFSGCQIWDPEKVERNEYQTFIKKVCQLIDLAPEKIIEEKVNQILTDHNYNIEHALVFIEKHLKYTKEFIRLL